MVMVFMFTCLLPAGRAEARGRKVTNPNEVLLIGDSDRGSWTFQKYDVTGDGRADKLQIICQRKNRYSFNGFLIKINGKKAFQFPQSMKKKERPQGTEFWTISVKLLTLRNKKPFLFINTESVRPSGPLRGIFQYRHGKLKCIFNLMTFLNPKYMGYCYPNAAHVSGNTIRLKLWSYCYDIAGFESNIRLKYSNGTLKPSTRKARLGPSEIFDHASKLIRDVTLYWTATSRVVKKKLKKGSNAWLSHIYFSPTKVRFKVCYMEKGSLYIKSGWCNAAWTKNSRQPLLLTGLQYSN